MAYRKKAYTLKEEITEDGTRSRCFIGFQDGQGDYHELAVSPAFYAEFRRLELDNRRLESWDWRHREFNEVWDETLNRRALRLPKAINALPEIQKRRFLLYHEYDCNFYEIGEMEHCTPQAARRSVILAREKIKAQMKKYLCA